MKLARSLFALPLVLATTGVACFDTDPAVFVDATIDAPQLVVGEEVLGISLSGSYLLVLHLGARASGESEVSYGTFSLVAEDGTVMIETLPVTPSAASPVVVDPGGADTAVTFEISTGPDLLPSTIKDQLCAGPVAVSGVVEDSLATTSTPVQSEPFVVLGCN